jgi:hypothetical protein
MNLEKIQISGTCATPYHMFEPGVKEKQITGKADYGPPDCGGLTR